MERLNCLPEKREREREIERVKERERERKNESYEKHFFLQIKMVLSKAKTKEIKKFCTTLNILHYPIQRNVKTESTCNAIDSPTSNLAAITKMELFCTFLKKKTFYVDRAGEFNTDD